ncbi:hypothetical protein C1645_820021 [Glomus cerebriforme]|uniref:Uncharacterized protein n=1 Tax=Glomus cerebriforme TaxID=658196 RepID=A0A397T6J7_9GLOM|nr:hypothetical protein C1645_820021 [Glomus cerebriforme]
MNNSSLLRNISHSSEKEIQRSLDYDQQFVSFPTKSRWNNMSESREVELQELCENEPLDSLNQVEARYSDQNMHNQYVNEKKDSTLSELHNLPGYICEQLNKNNHFGFHQITNKDSLDFVDAEYIEYLNEKFGITDIQPVFIDHSGFVIWLLDKDGNMYEWDEMQQILRYMGKDLIDGLTNNFIYPENICEVIEDTGEWIPVKEFKCQMEEKAKRIWNNHIILKNIKLRN